MESKLSKLFELYQLRQKCKMLEAEIFNELPHGTYELHKELDGFVVTAVRGTYSPEFKERIRALYKAERERTGCPTEEIKYIRFVSRETDDEPDEQCQ